MRRGPGTFIAIGGPSGVGKDTLISYARDRLAGDAQFFFVQRTITRPPDSGAESHLSVDDAQFDRLELAGALALAWSAHGLRYGLPVEVDAAISSGRVVVANISRTILPQLKARYERVVAIAVSADAATVRDRLVDRGREDAETIRQRSERVVEKVSSDWIELANSGPVNEAGETLVRMLLNAPGQ